MLSSLSSTMSTVFFFAAFPGAQKILHRPKHSSDDIVRSKPIDEMQIDSMNTPLKRVTREEAEMSQVGAFSYITSDEERLGRFLAVSGLRPDAIRSAAASPGFLAGILE